MEEKKTRELSLNEMDRISGGIHDSEENRRYEDLTACPYCGITFRTCRERTKHVRDAHPERSA